jgi:hypothetical protein
MRSFSASARLAPLWPIFFAAGLVLFAAGAAQQPKPPSPSHTTGVSGHDPVRALEVWVERYRQGRERIDEHSLGDLRQKISDARLLWALDPGRSTAIAGVMLDLVGATLSTWSRGTEEPAESALPALRTLALEALEAHVDVSLYDWIAREVLPLSRSLPTERRLGALWLLIPRQIESTKLALFGCTRDPDVRIRSAALEALVGWSDETVHAFFLATLTHADDGVPDPVRGLAEQHFSKARIAPQSRALAPLAAYVRSGLVSSDWRATSRALALSRPLENAMIVPGLIEALAFWQKRGEAGVQSLRVRLEIARALEHRSGQAFGLQTSAWLAWWQAVERGDVRGIGPTSTGGAVPEGTQASFFGLKPTSDRVTFVIDRSGSMIEAIGLAAGKTQLVPHSRWDEATSQLLAFVAALGPKARFNIVLFHDFAESFRPELVAADDANREEARSWLKQRPGGGTLLRAGVERALALRPDGSVDLTRLECDTVIVLCDGATAEGPGWVEPFQSRINSSARVVFYCVQIGSGGDGTLEKLASGSGGEFVRVE